MLQFWVTTFNNVYADSLEARYYTLDEFAGLIRDTEEDQKAALPLVKLARFGSLRAPPSPGQLKAFGPGALGSLRHDRNVLMMSGGAGDYDRGVMPVTEIVTRLETAEIAYIVCTTPSHDPQRPRWRVWVPYSKELPVSLYAKIQDRLNGIAGGELSRESWPLSQSFFVGRVRGVPFEIYVGDFERCIDEVDELDTGALSFRPASGAGPGGGRGAPPDFESLEDADLEDEVRSGRHFWRPAKELLLRQERDGVSESDAIAYLEALFDEVPPPGRSKKWAKARKSIPGWVKQVYARARRKKGGATLTQVIAWLDGQPHWHNAIRYNEFTLVADVCDPFPPVAGQTIGNWRSLREPGDLLRALICIQEQGFPKATKGVVWDALLVVAENHPYHPPREYLEGCAKVWDGTARVHLLFIEYFHGALPEQEPVVAGSQELPAYEKMRRYLEAVGENFLKSAVARIFQPGCKVDTMPIFDAEQGDNKSLALRSLVPDERWFTDDVVVDVSERDAKEALRGKWIVEMSEVPHMRRDLNQFKAFVSRQVDHYRRAYDRLSQDWPRQCALAGSGNEVEFVDDTGNRRMWPVPTIGLADVAALARDRDQLWGEAVHLYRKDCRWWLTAEAEGYAREIQEGFNEEDPLDGPIIEWLDQHCPLKPDGSREATTPARVLVGLGYELKPRAGASFASVSVVASPADYRRVVRFLKRLGYRRDHRMRVRPNGRHGRRERLWVFRGKT